MVKGLSFKMLLLILKKIGVEHSQENGFGFSAMFLKVQVKKLLLLLAVG